MSESAQNRFEEIVADCFQQHRTMLHLSEPFFTRNGFVSTATMTGSGGCVELRCGPAEYHAELFIIDNLSNRRWAFADLLHIDGIRTWVERNHPSLAGRSLLEAEVDYAFTLLVSALKGGPGFSWLFGSS